MLAKQGYYFNYFLLYFVVSPGRDAERFPDAYAAQPGFHGLFERRLQPHSQGHHLVLLLASGCN